MASSGYDGPERRRVNRPAAEQRAEIAMRLLITTERLERLAARLEAYVTAPTGGPQREGEH